MITISQTELNLVEYLIGQSLQGNHVLFEIDKIRDILIEDQEKNPKKLDPRMEQVIERIIKLPSLAQKRDYLEKLDNRTYKKVVKTYFNLVENNLFDTKEMRH